MFSVIYVNEYVCFKIKIALGTSYSLVQDANQY